MASGTRRPELYPEHPDGRSSVPLLSDSSDSRNSSDLRSPRETHLHHQHHDDYRGPSSYQDHSDPYNPGRHGQPSPGPYHSNATSNSSNHSISSIHNAIMPSSTSSSRGSRPSTRRSTMRSRSPTRLAATSARKKYTYAAIFLSIGLISFCVQTELSAYIQGDLGWQKAYCMMFLTHSSWALVWPLQLLALRIQKRSLPWHVFWRRHIHLLLSTALVVELQTLDALGISRPAARSARYLLRTTALLTCALTVAGLSWYVAVSMTNPSDLTAIYNCSAFFAYAFSVPLLKEPLRLDKSLAVIVAIVGVLIVAYGDGGSSSSSSSSSPSPSPGNSATGGHDHKSGPGSDPSARFLGNIIIGIGSILYGLYEVLYKRLACGPANMSPGRTMIFSNFFASCIGAFTLLILWLPLVPLHLLGIETFEIPDASTCRLILIAVLSNAVFSASFLILIALTSPVLSSVSALLTIFIIALADWRITGEPLSHASLVGGAFIVFAFIALSWSTYREMMDEEMEKKKVDLADSDDEGEHLDG